MAVFTNWAIANGKKGFLGEFGGGTSQTCLTAINNMIAHMENNDNVWIGWYIQINFVNLNLYLKKYL